MISITPYQNRYVFQSVHQDHQSLVWDVMFMLTTIEGNTYLLSFPGKYLYSVYVLHVCVPLCMHLCVCMPLVCVYMCVCVCVCVHLQ